MDLSSLVPVFVITLVAVGAGVLAMAIGVILRRPCLRGSCGGPEVRAAGGEKISCTVCPNRKIGNQNRGRTTFFRTEKRGPSPISRLPIS